jgi:hypothetical protein
MSPDEPELKTILQCLKNLQSGNNNKKHTNSNSSHTYVNTYCITDGYSHPQAPVNKDFNYSRLF